jgi:hypothetical protein
MKSEAALSPSSSLQGEGEDVWKGSSDPGSSTGSSFLTLPRPLPLVPLRPVALVTLAGLPLLRTASDAFFAGALLPGDAEVSVVRPNLRLTCPKRTWQNQVRYVLGGGAGNQLPWQLQHS